MERLMISSASERIMTKISKFSIGWAKVYLLFMLLPVLFVKRVRKVQLPKPVVERDCFFLILELRTQLMERLISSTSEGKNVVKIQVFSVSLSKFLCVMFIVTCHLSRG
jgi:hypothetical protein